MHKLKFIERVFSPSRISLFGVTGVRRKQLSEVCVTPLVIYTSPAVVVVGPGPSTFSFCVCTQILLYDCTTGLEAVVVVL